MKLQPSYDAMSDVPAGFEGAYSEADGKAVFNGGEFEFKSEAEYTELQKAKQAGFDQLHELKAKLKDVDGLDPKAYKEALEELDVLRAKVKDGGTPEDEIKDIVDSRVARATEQFLNENKTLKEKLDELEGYKSKTEKTTLLKDVLAPHVSKDALADAEFIIGSAIERQADGTFMSNGKAGFEKGLSVEQVVAKAMESRAHWKKQNTPGAGAEGANGGGGLNKQSQLNALIERRKKGELSRTETKQMTTLAAEIKAEQKGQ